MSTPDLDALNRHMTPKPCSLLDFATAIFGRQDPS
jgi:hypothetical protein